MKTRFRNCPACRELTPARNIVCRKPMNTITIQARKCGTTVIWQAPWQVATDTGNGCPPSGIRVEGTVGQRVIAAVLLTLPMVTREAFFSCGRSERLVQARETAAWVLRHAGGLSFGAISGILHRDHRMVVEAVKRAAAKRQRSTEYNSLVSAVLTRCGLSMP